MSSAQRRGAALRVVASLSAAYFVSQFFRSANAVIAPELMRDLGLAPRALGLVTGAFFLAFGAFQIPVGVLLDRFGPRRVVPAMFSFAVAGALVFAAADTALGLALGRALMGVGCASAFMGGLVACARWFPPDRFATVSASILAAGGTGALLSTTPLAFAAETVGWRGAFVAMAGLTALVAALVYAVVRDAPPEEGGAPATDDPGAPPAAPPPRETLRGSLAGLREVFASPQVPGLLAMGFVAYPVFATVATLWAGPYLADVYGLDPVARGNALAIATVATLAGTLGYGPLDRVFDSRKRVVIGGALATLAVLVILAAAPRLAVWQAVALLTLFGIVGVYSVMVLTHGRASFPDRLVGRAVTTVNLAGFVGVAVFQAITGVIVEAFADPTTGAPVPAIAYRAVFAALAATILVALFLYRRTTDIRPSTGLPRGRGKVRESEEGRTEGGWPPREDSNL